MSFLQALMDEAGHSAAPSPEIMGDPITRDPITRDRPTSEDFRAVHRVIADLRGGLPCVVTDDFSGLAMLPVETMTAATLAELLGLAPGGATVLILSAARAAALTGEPAAQGMPPMAIPLAASMLEPRALRGLADPTSEQIAAAPIATIVAPSGAWASLELAKLARLLPALVAVPIAGGGRSGIAPVAGLLAVTAAEVARFRRAHARTLIRASQARVPLPEAADAWVVAFRESYSATEHLAIVVGSPNGGDVGHTADRETGQAPLVRLHSECLTGDMLGSLRCDCGPQLRGALRRMADEGSGVVLYLAQEGRGIGLVNKLRAYALQDRGLDTLDANRALGWGADERDFGVAADMLRALGISRVRLLTNNPNKVAALARAGITVDRVSHLMASNGVNDAYLAAKVARFGHLPE